MFDSSFPPNNTQQRTDFPNDSHDGAFIFWNIMLLAVPPPKNSAQIRPTPRHSRQLTRKASAKLASARQHHSQWSVTAGTITVQTRQCALTVLMNRWSFYYFLMVLPPCGARKKQHLLTLDFGLCWYTQFAEIETKYLVNFFSIQTTFLKGNQV